MYKQTRSAAFSGSSPDEISKELQHGEGRRTIDVLPVVQVVEILAHQEISRTTIR
jgi:hypothetical protein